MRLIHFPSWGLAWNSVKRTSSRISTSPRNRVRSYGPHVQRVLCSHGTISAAFQPPQEEHHAAVALPLQNSFKCVGAVLCFCRVAIALGCPRVLSHANEFSQTVSHSFESEQRNALRSSRTCEAVHGLAKGRSGWACDASILQGIG